jgi:hypothetical protein
MPAESQIDNDQEEKLSGTIFMLAAPTKFLSG